MTLGELWRYPVKSMAGESLQQAELTPEGLAGDRIVHVEDATGRFITARTHPQLLGHRARLGSSGEPMVDGRPWNDPLIRQQVQAIVGLGARLVRDGTPERFDVLPLLIATDGAIAAFGHDGRRLRPNLVVVGVDGLAERSWPGKRLQIGDALIGIQGLRSRCVMTTYDPDTLWQDRSVLQGIVQRFNGRLALDCYVIRSGTLHVGDAVELL